MTLGGVLAVAATLALLGYGLLAWEHIVRRRREAEAAGDVGASSGGGWGTATRARAARPSVEPDAPAFPRAAAAWLALRTTDLDGVVRALRLRTVLPANWRSGLDEVADGAVFVTPPVAGWVLAIGAVFAARDAERWLPELLERLGGSFATIVWAAADDAGERHGWALCERGELRRGYAFDGELGTTFWHGDVTAAEHALRCHVDDPRDGSDDDIKWWPDAALVRRLAAAWSLDVDRLGAGSAPPAVGRVGRL